MLVLSPTQDKVLRDGDLLCHLDIDPQGNLSLSTDALIQTLKDLTNAINTTHDRVKALERDAYDLRESMEAVKQQTTKMGHRVCDCEDTGRDLRIQMSTMLGSGNYEDEDEHDDDDKGNYATENFSDVGEKVESLVAQIEELESRLGEETSNREEAFEEIQANIKGMLELFQENNEPRIQELEDSMAASKIGIDALRTGLQECTKVKATRGEVMQVSRMIEGIIEEHRAEAELRARTLESLVKLDNCLELASANKEGIQFLMRLFREETTECREWCSRNFGEVRAALRAVAGDIHGQKRLDEFEKEFRLTASQLKEATVRVEAYLVRKAEIRDVLRLEQRVTEAVDDLRPRQLLLGTRCLACDRGSTAAHVTDQTIVELAQARQQEDLFRETNEAVRRQEFSPDSREVLRYVAVHVGNQINTPGRDGTGIYKARDDSSSAQWKHGAQLVRTSGRAGAPSTGAAQRRLGSAASSRGSRTSQREGRTAGELVYSPRQPTFGSRKAPRPGDNAVAYVPLVEGEPSNQFEERRQDGAVGAQANYRHGSSSGVAPISAGSSLPPIGAGIIDSAFPPRPDHDESADTSEYGEEADLGEHEVARQPRASGGDTWLPRLTGQEEGLD